MAKSKEIDISMGAEALKENGYFCLEQGKWKLAKQYFEKAIEINPRNSYLYIGVLLTKYQLKNIDLLPKAPEDFRKTNNYKLALRYADDEFKAKLAEYVEKYKSILDEKYQKAIDGLSSAKTIDDYKQCYEVFLSLGKHKDAEKYVLSTKEFIDQHNYDLCVEKMKQELTESEYLELFNILSGMNYKESNALAKECKSHYNSLKRSREENEKIEKIYSSACASFKHASSIKEILSAKESFESIADYKDSKDWILKCEDKINSKKVAFLLYKIWNNNKLLVCIACTLVVLFGFIISDTLGYIIAMIISLGAGLLAAWGIGNGKWIYAGRSLLIATVVGLFLALIVSTSSSGGGNSKGSGTCGICGGSGTVTSKILGEGAGIQKGFDTYYRCKGCHGTGRD